MVPFLVIPGQVRMATIEEEFFERKYKDAYANYKRETGKFLPKLRHSKVASK
jgi:protein-S-isoprenylcysteine O-methyltransferase Ste14